jgi:sigma-B regulation protein RsbU (phosphoserine phosphatase)
MGALPPSRRILLATLAALFGLAVVAYAAIWIYYLHWGLPRAFLGIRFDFDPVAQCLAVHEPIADTPAARAGLQKGDCIVAVNGQALPTPRPFYDIVVRGEPGDRVHLSVRRKTATTTADVTLAIRDPDEPGAARAVVWQIVNLYPVPFVVVGLTVLALRPFARDAWLLALLFTGFGVGPLEQESVIHPALRGFAAAFNLVMQGAFPALFYYFMAVFPVPSALDRRVPLLKWLLVGLMVPAFIACGAVVLAGGTSWALWPIVAWVGPSRWEFLFTSIYYASLALGFVSLALNCYRPPIAEAKRKARLIAWSFAVGYLPWVAIQSYALSRGKSPLALPLLVWGPAVIMLMVLPVLFAYAVVRHRVLEFSVLVKRSARYLFVQRGFVVISVLAGIGVTLAFAVYGARWLPRLTTAALPAGIAIGALFGLVMVLAAGAVARRITPRIDRAFFRSAYNAQQILEDLAQKAAAVSTREELAALLDQHLGEALHPARLAVYLRTRGRLLTRYADTGTTSPGTLDPDLDVVQAAARQARPWDVSEPVESEVVAGSVLAPLGPDCLVPVLGRGRGLVGLLVLGPRMSDEPYSREDKKLLASVASQAGIALESLALAEDMVDRLETERRAAQEVEIAAEVQRRLLPQTRRTLRTGEYDGRCVQAKAIGGDYYDFIDLGADQIGLVLADVSGKGIYAALLMANLQAQLRSLSARASESLPRWLESVNHAFYESTARNHYATLFMGAYDDAQRRLRYVNCGHLPPMLLRASGALERLEVTAGAVGLFDDWSCTVGETHMAPGDLLVIASDGVTEATSPGGDEFGEAKLAEAIGGTGGRSPSDVIDAIISAVRTFTAGEQTDDLTLAVLRAR